MGSRSQIFVRYEKGNQKKMVARYFQSNYGAGMISRARYSMEWLKKMYHYPGMIAERLCRILDTNFDLIDCARSSDIIKEFDEYDWGDWTLNDYMFKYQDNNNGKLLVDVLPDGTLKYAFLDSCNNMLLSASEYMRSEKGETWTAPTEYMDQETIDTCIKNIEAIGEMATVMTVEEVQEFMARDYSCLAKRGPSVWMKTDDMQWRKKISDKQYHLVEVRALPDGYIYVTGIIDLTDYTDKEILSYISGYGYASVEAMKKTYEENVDGVIAECIFECTAELELTCFGSFTSEDEAEAAAEKYIEVQKEYEKGKR